MIPIVIESPYAAAHPFTAADHERYLSLCILDCLRRGETPYASHRMLTKALDDLIPEQRKQGIDAGLAMGNYIRNVAVYVDLGISKGMALGIGHHRLVGNRQDLRRLFSPAIGQALRAGQMTLAEVEAMQ